MVSLWMWQIRKYTWIPKNEK